MSELTNTHETTSMLKECLPRRSEDPCHSLEIFGSVPRIFSVFFLYRHHLRKALLFDRWTLLQTPLPLVPRPLPGHKQTDWFRRSVEGRWHGGIELHLPLPNSTLNLTCYQLTNVELGEGQVRRVSDTEIDLRSWQETFSRWVDFRGKLVVFMNLLNKIKTGVKDTFSSITSSSIENVKAWMTSAPARRNSRCTWRT